MRIIKHLKKNNGSTLTLVLFMLFLLSVTAIAVITLTGSELSMSVMNSDRSKALLIAQAGAEKAAQVLDQAVAQKQEDARVKSSQVVQAKMDEAIKKVNADGVIVRRNIPVDSPFYKVIDNSDIYNIKILNEEALNAIYYNEYKFWFYTKINDWFSDDKFIGGTVAGGDFTYEGVQPRPNGTMTSQLDSGTTTATKSIDITSTGEYKSPSNGSTYKRTIVVEFGLLTDSVKSEIPVSYGKMTKVRAEKKSKPSILNKALIAQKNIISARGNVSIKGDAMCVGTIADYADKYDKYKGSGNSYKFGGIMAGITNDVWNDPDFVHAGGIISLRSNLVGLGLLSDFSNHAGSIDIEGSVGTLAYVHSLYDSSKIKISWNTYARSIKIENEAKNSKASFSNNVYMTDDLIIDANNAVVKIGGWSEGLLPEPIGNKSLFVGLNTGASSFNSSSVAVSGDSKLYINSKLYIGGSNYYNEYTTGSNKEMYMSGMSVQKSGSLPAQIFEMSGIDSTPHTESLPDDVLFYYDNTRDINSTFDSADYIALTQAANEEGQRFSTKEYSYGSSSTPKKIMMEDVIGVSDSVGDIIGLPKSFNILRKAMHFKWIWNNSWQNLEYYSSINTGDITIATTTTAQSGIGKYEGELEGWCPGAVGANYKVYGPYGENDAKFAGIYTDLISEMGTGKVNYANWMDLFVKSPDDLDVTASEVATATNLKSLSENVKKPLDTELTQDAKFTKTNTNVFSYYSKENVVLENGRVGNSSDSNELTLDSEGYIQGIVYSDKDIYVEDGTKFKGILIAEGNIVFLGGANIIYDEKVADILLCEKSVGNFFKYSTYDVIMNDENAIIQTIKKANVKNIKIKSWKEI